MAVDKLVDSTQLDADLTSVANAIRAKSGGSNSLAFPSEFITEIASIPTGSSVQVDPLSVSQNGTYTAPSGHAYSPVTVNVSGGGTEVVNMGDPVRFFDYDGTLVHSYSASDFQALTAMPSNPYHAGLTAQGWNWSLADAKAQVTAMGMCDIGQMYVTSDGKTRLYCHFEEGRLNPYVGLYPNGTVTIDWGDNSATDTLTGTSLTTRKNVGHVYASSGDYVITLTPTSGTFAIRGSNFSHLLNKAAGTAQYVSNVYGNTIKKVELGNSVTLSNYAFTQCYSLETITMPSHITSIGTFAFQNCVSLKQLTIPSGVAVLENYVLNLCYSIRSTSIPKSVTSINQQALRYQYGTERQVLPYTVTSIGANTFYNGYALSSFVLPPNITAIEASTFYACYGLPKITIPSGVTSIAGSAFQNCYGLGEIHFKPTTPPTVANANAFTNVPTDCKIYVPTGTLSDYTSATNYPSSATYTYIEE